MLRLLIGFGFVVIGTVSAVAGAQDEAVPPLTTRWASDVTPDNVWNAYPRPTLRRDAWTSLNGLWNYAITPRDAGTPDVWEGTILVPFCVESALSRVQRRVGPNQALWYRRTLAMSPAEKGKRILLNFGAVDWDATIWVNGVEVGSHQGGYDAFSLDISDAFNTSGEQVITVRVWDPTDTGYQPRGKQVRKPDGIWYTPVTGIWQTVWLETVPTAHITSIRTVPDVRRRAFDVTVRSSRHGKVSVWVLENGAVTAREDGVSGQPIRLPIPEPHLWSPGDPYLYDIIAELRVGDQVDRIDSYAGMRSVEVRIGSDRLPRLFLNDEPLFQYGVLDQGWWPDGLYTAPTDDALKYDIEVAKSLGFNMIRKHVKVEPERWYTWCDRLGILVWQDMPSGDQAIEMNAPDDITRTRDSTSGFLRELAAMVHGRGNHPSIVSWITYNEGWGQWETERVASMVKSWDPARVVNSASGWVDRGVGDVIDVHKYPGPALPPPDLRRAAVLGEFGGIGVPVTDHVWNDEGNWSYRTVESTDAFTEAYVDLIAELRLLIDQGLAAAVYTQTTDVENEVNGVMTYDRAVIKLDAARAAQAAATLSDS